MGKTKPQLVVRTLWGNVGQMQHHSMKIESLWALGLLPQSTKDKDCCMRGFTIVMRDYTDKWIIARPYWKQNSDHLSSSYFSNQPKWSVSCQLSYFFPLFPLQVQRGRTRYVSQTNHVRSHFQLARIQLPASNHSSPKAFPFFTIKFSHFSACFGVPPKISDGGWLPGYSKLWRNSLCLFSFGWFSFISRGKHNKEVNSIAYSALDLPHPMLWLFLTQQTIWSY